MSVRMSFTLESDLADQIETFAREKRIERNEAILRLIEAGIEKYAEDDAFSPPRRERSFEEAKVIVRSLEDLKTTVSDLKKEVRVVHHILDLEWQNTPKQQPVHERRWWEFWKGL
ncbi:MAG: type II secretion system protein E [Methanocalculus sp. MSAO_Arc2]|uniref:type II secretion system protein E n=1 Tax=Methanocalculus sp. MSAO_Arc2 TaxID=2293855 RepID=UPI000FED1410|nr:MAG: type II secretion system protein E [Methanocalculus sp. MSAO_Arc2]